MESVSNDFGAKFPKGMRWFGYVCFFAAIALLIAGIGTPAAGLAVLGGLAVGLLGGYLVFVKTGVEINPAQDKYRNYSEFVWSRWGKWESYDSYPDVAILRKQIASTGYSRGGVSTTIREQVFCIYLLGPSHRKQLLVGSETTPEAARDAAKKLAEVLGRRFVTYSPKISEQTRARRR